MQNIMKYLFATVALLPWALSLDIPGLPGGLDPIKYEEEYEFCKDADRTTVYAAIRYQNGTIGAANYNQCIHFGDKNIADVFVCRPTTCYNFLDANCKKESLPVGVLVPTPVDIPDGGEATKLLGQSADCIPNDLPTLPPF